MLKEHLNDDENTKAIFFQFANCKIEIRRIFEASHEETKTKQIVEYLRQKTSTIEYLIKFQKQLD
jgi:hypothetical protein